MGWSKYGVRFCGSLKLQLLAKPMRLKSRLRRLRLITLNYFLIDVKYLPVAPKSRGIS
jgi:hypothetical protein